MSMLSEQVKYLREFDCFGTVKQAMLEAADTIEALSAKASVSNMERSDRYYEIRKELVEQHNKAFELINRIPLEGNEVWHGYVSGVMQTLGSLINYMDSRP